jgi:hypothetical protein
MKTRNILESMKAIHNNNNNNNNNNNAMSQADYDEMVRDLKAKMISSYDLIYTLLHDKLEKSKAHNSGWTPKLTGLARITSDKDGVTAWVLNDPEVIAKFHGEGSKVLKIPMK